jgi:F0F1-type ATP synthase assembly protein I
MAIDPAVTPKQPERSLGELFGQLTSDLSQLFRKEVELAKLETKEEVQRAGKAGGMIGAAAATGYLALILVSFALGWLLDEWMHTALAFLLVGALWAIAATVLYSRGRQHMKQINPVPEQTVQTLKEDVAWARAQTS